MRIDAIRAVVEHSSTLYYPIVISADWSSTFPFSCPEATIVVHTELDSGDTGYMAPIRAGDVIRLQTSTKLATTDDEIWEDAFEGRIQNIVPSFSIGDDSTTLVCLGHEHDTVYSMITADLSYGIQKTGYLLQQMITYLSRITDASPSLIDTTNSTDVTSYNVQDDTRNVGDVIGDMESAEGWGYRFQVVTVYSSGLYSACYFSWQPVPSTATTSASVIEGTRRYLGGDFQTNMDRLVNDVTVYGESGTPQKYGDATDATSISTYGKRRYVFTLKGYNSNYLCGLIASKYVARWKDPAVIGSVQITGENDIFPGDLIYVKIPSITLAASSIDGNYRVRAVSHTFSATDGWITTLDVGEILEDPANIVVQLMRGNRINNSNFVD